MGIMSFKAETEIKIKHMEEKDKKVEKFGNLRRNWLIKLIKKVRNRIVKLIKKGGKIEHQSYNNTLLEKICT